VHKLRHTVYGAGGKNHRVEMIECREVTKRFGDLAAVDRVSLRVEPGIFAVLGPNGAAVSPVRPVVYGRGIGAEAPDTRPFCAS
jgi:ABC-type uncharacterized transport system ATPase subunit